VSARGAARVLTERLRGGGSARGRPRWRTPAHPAPRLALGPFAVPHRAPRARQFIRARARIAAWRTSASSEASPAVASR
jgi:hypothetical protein